MECAECKHRVSTQASACPNCGCPIATPVIATDSRILSVQVKPARNMALWKILLAAFGLFCLIGIIVNMDGKSDQTVPTQSSNISGTTDEQTALPKDEVDFISTINSFQTRYGEGANEFQKSAVRRQRAEAFAALLPSHSVENWVAQISSMSTNSDGNGVLCLVLPGSQIKVKTWNNSLSDIEDNTLISRASPLYGEVANLAEGNTVFFSGRFAFSDLDYIKESSLTEQGAMTEPEFIFTFANVGKQPFVLTMKPSLPDQGEEQGADITTPQSDNSNTPSGIPASTGTAAQVETDPNQSYPNAPTPNHTETTEAKSDNPSTTVIKGQTVSEVVAILGPPVSVTLGPERVYSYPHLRIIFVNGTVSEIQHLSDDGGTLPGSAVLK